MQPDLYRSVRQVITRWGVVALIAFLGVAPAQAATPPVFMVQPATQFLLVGGNATFTALAGGSAPISYQWQSGTAVWDPVTLTMVVNTWTDLSDGSVYAGTSTGTLTITGVTFAMSSLQVRCVATNGAGSATSTAAGLGLQFVIYQGAYFGTLSGGGHWALFVRSPTTGDFIAYLPGRGSAIVQPVTVDQVGGTFSGTGTEQVAQGTAANFTLSGQVQAPVNGSGLRTVTGQLTGLGETFTGDFRAGNGSLTPFSGSFYTAAALNGDKGTVYAIVGYGGDVLAVAVSPALVDSAGGLLNAGGSFSATTAAGGQFTLTVDPAGQSLSASLTAIATTKATRYAGLAAAVQSTRR